ncbi:MAG TPA: DNA double-strand break repair nuclease NurA [Candidatus Nanoarchaeia archaeon]|nr:DNA double-strand break repair nuclease NurA [Candidatus Nanoarchaeia archaeon]
MKLRQLKDLLPQLKEALSQRGSKIVVSGSYEIAVDPNNFFSVTPLPSSNSVVFIDGGNAEVIGAVNVSLQMIRLAASTYKCNTQESFLRKESFCLTTTVPKKGQLFFKTSMTPNLVDVPVFSIQDPTIAPKRGLPSVSLMPEIARRFAEISLATEALVSLERDDVVVMDGLLSPRYTGEDLLIEDLLAKAKHKGITILGLAKTSRLMTEAGDSAMDALASVSPGGLWRYSSPADKQSITTHFVRLHPNSTHVFRLEVPSFCLDNLDEALSTLASQSTDPIFLGYPYGLIAADKLARVSNHEQEYLRLALQSVAGKDFKDIAQAMRSIDAHQILDSM